MSQENYILNLQGHFAKLKAYKSHSYEILVNFCQSTRCRFQNTLFLKKYNFREYNSRHGCVPVFLCILQAGTCRISA